MAMDGIIGSLGMQVKVTVGNEYAEFKTWHDRTELNKKLAMGVKKTGAEMAKSFSTMSTSLENYVATMEKAYPKSDDLRELIKHTVEKAGQLETAWHTPKHDFAKEIDAFLNEIIQVEKGWQNLQKTYDAFHKMKKDHEKVVAKGDESKITSSQHTLDSKKQDFEGQMQSSIEKMKTVDAKRQPLFDFVLAAVSGNVKQRCATFRESLQHSLNFAVNGINECENKNLLDFDTEKMLSTPIPDLGQTAVVMKLKEDNSWCKVDE
ncbi:hypothetical protein FVE85_9478 [Porphyridium purpureum]|uniref:BAR domain-containing protein n=1 Tax=Porphyridium purpureum TaxID=35688 RepID=A0A5J4YKN6_PORPP|nr:hypothetical protein FVE85_9478 [Porphyridium purpureum]|eukprot:POR1175..scf261_15